VTQTGGRLLRIRHDSAATGTEMTFGLFLPTCYGKMLRSKGQQIAALYWLSGLTCDDTNFSSKAGAFGAAEREGIVLVMPDTSPRGKDAADDETYDLGQGAGFYVDASEAPWSDKFKMETYVMEELPDLLSESYGVDRDVRSISGHSMGGHGALTLAFRHPESWESVSAFAPICNPTECPWGVRAFENYLGSVAAGKDHDASLLLASRGPFDKFDDILIDQGLDDQFLASGQLHPESIEAAAEAVGQKVTLRRQANHDHSYFFISTFIDDHITFHAKRLRLAQAKKRASAASSSTVGDTAGRPITCRAMVARAPKQPLTLETITVDPPGPGEVRLKVVANALCHTDVYTLDGQDPEGLFPCILGHEAGCVVESVGKGVTSVAPGDSVVPCYTPQCSKTSCIFCQSPRTNLCPAIRSTQGKGVMPDGTVRFHDADGKDLYHFMGCSTMAEYTVVAEISCAKVAPEAPLEKICLFGCGVSTGLGAVWNTCKVCPDSTVAVFGLGAVGLSVIQGAKMAGATRIIAVDINPTKFELAIRSGATECVNSADLDVPVQQHIAGVLTPWGVDFSFDCTGITSVMRAALECSHRGWGTSCIIGVAASGHEISTRPFQLVTGRTWKGTAFGGFKSRTDVPKLVNRMMSGELSIDQYITHVFDGVDKTNDAIDVLHGGSCLRAVVQY